MAHSVRDIDEAALVEAQRILGTSTTKDTVNAALREVARQKLVAELLDDMSSQDPVELERLREEAWR